MFKIKVINRFTILIYTNVRKSLTCYYSYSFIFKIFIIINSLISGRN
jgi:hypothetical protein